MTFEGVSRPKRLIKGREFRRRMGELSRTTFWRLSKEDPDFPKAVPVRGGQYYEEGEADAYIDLKIARREVP